jgi:hypothetical protein
MCGHQSEGGHQKTRRPPSHETDGAQLALSSAYSLSSTLGRTRICNRLVRNPNPCASREPAVCRRRWHTAKLTLGQPLSD